MDMLRRASLPLLAGAFAVLGVAAVRSSPVVLEPGSPAWRRLAGGATPSGRVHGRAVVTLPGLRRSDAGEARLRVEPDTPAWPVVRYAVDRGPLTSARTDRNGELALTLPPSTAPGARLFLSPDEGAPPLRVRSIAVAPAPSSRWPFVLAAAFTIGVAVAVGRRRGARLTASTGFTAGAIASLAAAPALLWLSLPAMPALARLLVPLAGLVASAVFVHARRGDRQFYGAVTALVLAAVFGGWVRLYFLPSAGSWDTEYWKAWMHRAVSHGVSRVYGDPDATPEGHFQAQLWGREALWQPEYRGRRFVVDYPPLAMALWSASFEAVSGLAPGLDRTEMENVAVKLPAVLGDVLAVLLLLYVFRRHRTRGAILAALYWALPVSWLSSAVLGFLDAAYAPFAVAALVAAGAGRAGWSGALVAVAALIKPQAVIVAPAAAVALVAHGSRLRRAFAAGLIVVGFALVPFAAAGTLEEAVVHVFRILFQQRLSAGFANPWWIAGHAATAADISEPVTYARIDALGFPAGPLALLLFAVAAVWICRRQRAFAGPEAACLAGGALVLAYSMLAMGVHHNHPHAMFLAFAASGPVSRRLQILVATLSLTYVLNMLCLSVLGRFYGYRYLAVESLAASLSRLRMMPGLDLTLVLALVNTVAFALLLVFLRAELEIARRGLAGSR